MSFTQYDQNQNFTYVVENLLFYDKQFTADHSLGVTLLQSIQQDCGEGSSISAANLPYDSQKWYNLGSTNNAAAQSFGSGPFVQRQLMSWMGRVNYSFRDREWERTNTINVGLERWTAAKAPTPAQVGQSKFALGDTVIFIRVNTPQTTLTSAQIARTRYATFARYFRNANGSLGFAFDPTGTVGVRNKYPQLLKYIDPFRAGSGVNEDAGTRDDILARFAEIYLIAAEAYGRKGDYTKALSYINILRNRAAYKAGEAKPTAFSLVEGGTCGDVASTAGALQVTMAKFTTNDPAELYPPSVTTQQARFIAFILNERTRELAGELHRWEDLVRTETLLERA